MTASIFRVEGFVKVNGPGEATFTVDFPVLFSELPIIASGFHLADGQVLEAGNFPTVSIGAHKYTFEERLPGVRYYKGAICVIVATGHTDMKMTAHYTFEGTALVGPAGPAAGLI